MTGGLSIAQARQRIDEICLRIDGRLASAKPARKTPYAECVEINWWLEDDTQKHDRSSRRQALLTAYVVIGGQEFPMTGIPLSDGYLRPDRAVMGRALRAGLMASANGRFRITASGRALIGPGDPPSETLALQPGSERDGTGFGGGEGEHHRALRLWVLQHPDRVLPDLTVASAHTEYLLPSADRIDVLYESAGLRVALEVKSQDSNPADLARGIYQCVKYRAVLRAMADCGNVRAVLVTEGALPPSLVADAARLCIEHITVSPDRSV